MPELIAKPDRGSAASAPAPHSDRQRWLALGVVCLGVVMIVLDTTVVNVALPSIKGSLALSPESLAWIVNAYILTYGGFLLLGGRLGDLYGHRRLFLVGITVFTLASLACGMTNAPLLLVAARAIQGVGGAVVNAVALSLIMELFSGETDRAKALGVYSFVCAGGGSIGAMLGGFLTDALNWHWVFLINIPIGIAVFALSLRLLPGVSERPAERRLDVAGAVAVTTALMLAVYAIVNGNERGWTSSHTLGLLATAVALLIAFVAIEAKLRAPLLPLGLFRLRNLAVANIVGVLWAAAMFAWFFLSALYMQLVLGYTPMQVGLAFLPGNLIMAAFALGLSARLVMRFGIRKPLAAGLAVAAVGLLLFARAPVDADFTRDILPAMILLGLGGGVAFNPVLLAAMGDVRPDQSGLASGIVSTSFMLGGALGLAVLASLAAARTQAVTADATLALVGHAEGDAAITIAKGIAVQALAAGYHVAFLVSACFAALAALIGALFMRATKPTVTAAVAPH